MAEFLILDIPHVWDDVDIGILAGIYGPEISPALNVAVTDTLQVDWEITFLGA
jgi:hypothetical protein